MFSYEGGRLGGYLEKCKLGDKVQISGPVGHLTYHGSGVFQQNKKTFNIKHLCLVCGGTGNKHYLILLDQGQLFEIGQLFISGK